MLLKIAVKAAQRGKAAFHRTAQARGVGVRQQVRGVMQSPFIYVKIAGKAHFAFKKAGNVFGVIMNALGNVLYGAGGFKVFFNIK